MRSLRGRLCHRDGLRTGRKDRAGKEPKERERNAEEGNERGQPAERPGCI